MNIVKCIYNQNYIINKNKLYILNNCTKLVIAMCTYTLKVENTNGRFTTLLEIAGKRRNLVLFQNLSALSRGYRSISPIFLKW